MTTRPAARARLAALVADAARVLEERSAALVPEARKAALPATEDYDVVRADLSNRLFDAFMGFLSSAGSVTKWRNAARRALVEDVPGAFYRGYEDAAGADAETEPEDERWITAETARQMAFMDYTFEALREIRADESARESDVEARCETWARTLDGIYSEGKLRGAGNVMLTFDGDDGNESCPECQKYKGQRHGARWWIARDLVRRNGNDNYGCGRWEPCQHDLYDDDGEMFTR